MAEIIPFEPDLDNAGVGSGDTKTIIRAISYEGKRIWLFVLVMGSEHVANSKYS
jgi:hypothetical protein